MMAPELTVVGAGPAGLAAATAAAEAGVRTWIVDEYGEAGGQYYRQPLTPAAQSHVSRQQREGARTIDAARLAGVDVANSAIAYGFEGGKLFCASRSLLPAATGIELARVLADHAIPLILATGATERVVPVPGWTLPGVVTCGGAQALAKAYGVPVGSRVLVAGSGPFLLPVAATLVGLGARVVAVVEAARPRVGTGLALARSPRRLGEAAGYFATLARARVPLLFGHAVTRIDGTDTVRAVTVAPLGPDGEVVPGRVRKFDVDAVALSDGFIPTVDLIELAGGGVWFEPTTRSYLVDVQRSTFNVQRVRGGRGHQNRSRSQEMPVSEDHADLVEGVWAAGACVEALCGAGLAAATGTVAGLSAVEAIRGRLTGTQQAARERARAEVRRQRAFAAALAAAYPVRPAWYRRVSDDTVVCRCEDVRAGDIRAAAVAGARDVNLVKRWTRAGMGLCQGRTCQSAVIELVATALNLPAPGVGRFRPRPPIRPVPLNVLAAMEHEDIAH